MTCNAPATFQRQMDKVLHGLKWYIDDIVLVGGKMQEHLHNLGCVFMRLREAGLKLKPSKCRFVQKEVTFLGHVVSEKGISTQCCRDMVFSRYRLYRDISRYE